MRASFVPLLAAGLLATPAWAQQEPVPDAAPTIEVDALPLAPAIGVFPDKDWARRDLLAPADAARFNAAADRAFAEPQPADLTQTRALLVVQNGSLVYERYADGFGPDTKFLSWSVAKSFTHALAGIAARDGLIDPDAPLDVPEWTAGDDLRRAIHMRHLLTNTSGLRWLSAGESSLIESDEAQILYGRGRRDAAEYIRTQTLESPPGTVFEYNSGNFDLAAAQIGLRLGAGGAPADRRAAMHAFMTGKLFAPLGITSAVAEFDAAGTFLGGSNLYMTAQDYARFGLLYLRGGTWNGEQILPEGWTEFAAAPNPSGQPINYGAGFWRNSGTNAMQMPQVPASAYNASGNDGQIILIVPSHELVIVRLGKTPFERLDDIGLFLQELVLSFPQRAP